MLGQTRHWLIGLALFVGFSVIYGIAGMNTGFGFSVLLPIVTVVFIGLIFGFYYLIGLVVWGWFRIVGKRKPHIRAIQNSVMRYATINSSLVAFTTVVLFIINTYSGELFDGSVYVFAIVITLFSLFTFVPNLLISIRNSQ